MATRPQNWEVVKALLEAALEKEPARRAAFVKESCADATVCAEVERLLAEHDEAGRFLSTPALRDFPIATDASNASSLARTASIVSSESVGTVIGRYHLIHKIGEGGMGEVWEAEQKEPIRRRVAVKLIKAGMNTREVMARFESERQALALMDHSAIAKVFDAGSTPQGAPYFVMEYVAGVSITSYCDIHRLSIRERLELFTHVCEGVQHAHQKAIIHRDLKPSNILVTEVDGRAVPKIIDFGVAKALSQKLTADTIFTRAGALVGTPEYMSPEQANSSGEDIDTRSDVYSLGIILYELLAGGPPIELRKIAFEEFLRRLREEDPPKPSTRISAHDPSASTELSRKRQTEPQALAKQLRGELDSIALKALEKDRTRRYASPSDFGADIGRYLNGAAVFAVPPSTAYRARKFARRYRTFLVTACAFALVLISAAAISIRQSIRANREAIRAGQEAAIAEAVNSFLQNDLLAQASAITQAGPTNKPDPHLEVRTALDRAAQRIEGKFAKQPEVEAAIRNTIGMTYTDLGQYPEAEKQLERAVDLRRRVLGPEHRNTLGSMHNLALVYQHAGKYAKAENLDNQILEIQRQTLGPEHPDTVASMDSLGLDYDILGKYAQAEILHSHALEIRRRVWGPENPNTVSSMDLLGMDYEAEGKYPQAEALFSQTLEISRRLFGPENPKTLALIDNLASVYQDERKDVEAERVLTQTVEIRRRVLGPEHPDTLECMNTLALVYSDEGKFAQAETLDKQILEVRRRVLGPEYRGTLESMVNLAADYGQEGKYAPAQALHSQALEISQRTLGPEDPYTLGAMHGLAADYGQEGKYVQAEAMFSHTLEIHRRVLGPEHTATLSSLSDFAVIYQRQNKYALAATYAAQALAGRRNTLGSEHPDTMASAADLALAYLSQNKFAEGELLARETLEFYRKNQPEDWERFRAESLLGDSLAGQKKYVEAEPLLLEGYQGMAARKDRMGVPNWYHLDCAREWIVQLYRAWGKPEKAAEWRKKTVGSQRVSSE
jgi:eukaryotic-like serine/threonine-protein kinase